MFTVSPYELLRASIPKPAPTLVTNYDLYSAAHQTHTPEPALKPDSTPPASALQQHTRIHQTQSRTHYIEEIKAQILAKTKDTIENVFISGRVKSRYL